MLAVAFTRFVLKRSWDRGFTTLKFLVPNAVASLGVMTFFITVKHYSFLHSAVLGIGAWFIVAFVAYLCFWVPTAREEARRHARANVYGEAIKKLNDAFAKTHTLRRANEPPSGKDLMETLTFLCGQLQQVFALKTGKNCSVCIKVAQDLDLVEENADMVTLCRDPRSNQDPVRRRVDYRPDVKHKVTDNTCFFEIFRELGKVEDKYYFNDHTSKDRRYRNTSLLVHQEAVEGTQEERLKKGRLPYETVLVAPISPLHFRHGDSPWIYGFLCIDSPTPHVFNETYDLAILQGVADGIFDLVGRFLRPRKVEQDETND